MTAMAASVRLTPCTTPWLWPARPATHRGAAICAVLSFAVGETVIMLRGARESNRD
jgi:hypothetical protein